MCSEEGMSMEVSDLQKSTQGITLVTYSVRTEKFVFVLEVASTRKTFVWILVCGGACVPCTCIFILSHHLDQLFSLVESFPPADAVMTTFSFTLFHSNHAHLKMSDQSHNLRRRTRKKFWLADVSRFKELPNQGHGNKMTTVNVHATSSN